MKKLSYLDILNRFKAQQYSQTSKFTKMEIETTMNKFPYEVKVNKLFSVQFLQTLWGITPKTQKGNQEAVVLKEYIITIFNYYNQVVYKDLKPQYRKSLSQDEHRQSMNRVNNYDFLNLVFSLTHFEEKQKYVVSQSRHNFLNQQDFQNSPSPIINNQQINQIQYYHQPADMASYKNPTSRKLVEVRKFQSDKTTLSITTQRGEKIQNLINDKFSSFDPMKSSNLKKKINLYVPLILRMHLNKIIGLNQLEGVATLDCKFKIKIPAKDLSQPIIQAIRSNLKIQFLNLQGQQRQYPLYQAIYDPIKKQINTEFSKILNVQTLTDFLWTPFDKIKLIVSLNVKEIILQNIPSMKQFLQIQDHAANSRGNMIIRFNNLQYIYNQQYYDQDQDNRLARCMSQISYKIDDCHIKEYQLAERLIQVQNTDTYKSSYQSRFYQQHFQIQDSCFVKWCQLKNQNRNKLVMDEQFIRSKNPQRLIQTLQEEKKQYEKQIKQVIFQEKRERQQYQKKIHSSTMNRNINNENKIPHKIKKVIYEPVIQNGITHYQPIQVQQNVYQINQNFVHQQQTSLLNPQTTSTKRQNYSPNYGPNYSPNYSPNYGQNYVPSYQTQAPINVNNVTFRGNNYQAIPQIYPYQQPIPGSSYQPVPYRYVQPIQPVHLIYTAREFDNQIQNIKQFNMGSPNTVQMFKIDSFSITHFVLPFYRMSLSSSLYLLLPPYFVGLISLTVFFGPGGFDFFFDRLGTISTLALAYIAFLQFIKDRIPPTPGVTYVEMLNYTQILITFIALLQSFVGAVNSDYTFVWYQNAFFWIAFILQVLITVFILLMLIKFYCFQLRKFNCKTGFRVIFRQDQWKNPKSDQKFSQMMKDHDKIYMQVVAINQIQKQKNLQNKSASKMLSKQNY